VVLGVTSPVSSTNIVNWGFDIMAEKSATAGKSQSDKFKELARELECDEDEAHWDERLEKVAKSKPEKPE